VFARADRREVRRTDGGEGGRKIEKDTERYRFLSPTSRYRGAPGEEGAGLYARLCTGPQRCRDRPPGGAGIMTPRTGPTGKDKGL
jgi:hypothetical protein